MRPRFAPVLLTAALAAAVGLGAARPARLAIVVQVPLPTTHVGDSYRYEACRPLPQPPNQCGGPSHQPTNPSGGQPPYRLYIDGFAPQGLHIDGRTGVISGRAAFGTDKQQPWRFRVCVRDLAGTTACMATSLLVEPRFDGLYCGELDFDVTGSAPGVPTQTLHLHNPISFRVTRGVIAGGANGRVLDANGNAEIKIPIAQAGEVDERYRFAPNAAGVMAVDGDINAQVTVGSATADVAGTLRATRATGSCG